MREVARHECEMVLLSLSVVPGAVRMAEAFKVCLDQWFMTIEELRAVRQVNLITSGDGGLEGQAENDPCCQRPARKHPR